MSDPSTKARILVVDDHASMAEMLADWLDERGFVGVPARTGSEALRLLDETGFDAVVTDLRMDDVNGLEVLARSRAIARDRPVVVITAYGALDSAIESMRRGAYDYLTKPINADELVILLSRALEERGSGKEPCAALTREVTAVSFGSLVTRSAAMKRVAAIASRLVDATAPILLTGETGTGKSLLARAIHAQGKRSAGRFVALNCAALPEHLLESELFGHARGAFTGAATARVGLFQEASGGTLLLDEIGELPIGLQAKLLHTLERGVVRPVGSNQEVPVDSRIIAATHRDLQALVRERTFREDLFYRLDVVAIKVPALRHRREDLPELAKCFLAGARARNPLSPAETLRPSVLATMLDYSWPGNVRQLEHAIERAVLLAREREIGTIELPPALRAVPGAEFSFHGPIVSLREAQRRYVSWALAQLGGRKVATAERLEIDFKTLQRWLVEGREQEPGGPARRLEPAGSHGSPARGDSDPDLTRGPPSSRP